MPNTKAVAGVRIGLLGDKFIINPTTKEMEGSQLDLLLAGTDSAILMIEVPPCFLSLEFNDQLLFSGIFWYKSLGNLLKSPNELIVGLL